MRFPLREAMWWFAIAATMSAAMFSTPSPPAVLTSMLLFAVPLGTMCAYLWTKSDAHGRRWMVLVAIAASVALLIVVLVHRSKFFEPLLFAPMWIYSTSDLVAYGVGCAGLVISRIVLLASLAGALLLGSRSYLGWIVLLLLVIWWYGWLYEAWQVAEVTTYSK